MVIDPLSVPVSGDPDRLLQIIWNLLSNAIKFTPRDGKVQIRLSRVNSHVEVAVCDTGRGIAPDFLPFVFERFRQVDATFSREQGGLGLGLAIAKQLAELHGGTITASSDGIGQGATFTLVLPLMIVHSQSARAAGQQPSADRHAPSMESVPRLDGIVVLAIDDEPDSLVLLTTVLKNAGAVVRTASSGPDALADLREHRPDVIVADVGMPGMDGLQLIRQIRLLDEPLRSTPAAALTAYARSQDRIASLASGFQMHLVKPIDPLELVVAVSRLAPRRTGKDAAGKGAAPRRTEHGPRRRRPHGGDDDVGHGPQHHEEHDRAQRGQERGRDTDDGAAEVTADPVRADHEQPAETRHDPEHRGVSGDGMHGGHDQRQSGRVDRHERIGVGLLRRLVPDRRHRLARLRPRQGARPILLDVQIARAPQIRFGHVAVRIRAARDTGPVNKTKDRDAGCEEPRDPEIRSGLFFYRWQDATPCSSMSCVKYPRKNSPDLIFQSSPDLIA
jgi:CheY-like chemotaxis protein